MRTPHLHDPLLLENRRGHLRRSADHGRGARPGKNAVLEHKAAIDRHLDASGIPVLHTAVFWGERSEIKPSEISPDLYRKWTEEVKSAPVLR